MTQQKGIFVGWLTPQNLCESVPWRKGDRKLPLFYWVFFWGHQIQWFVFDQWCNQETEDHRLNVRFKIGGFVLMPKTGIASLTHWYSHPWRHQNSKCHPKTSYLRSILAHTQTSPRLSRELPTSSMPHCTTTNILHVHPSHSQAPSQIQPHLLFERGTAEGSSNRELLSNIGISVKPSIWPTCIK